MQIESPRKDPSTPVAVPVDSVHAQLEKILSSPAFSTSERPSKLLRYLVSMALAGRGSEIKEYVIGVELFGRRESFDPQTDAIVRTEVSRLRAKLKAYYSGDGSNDSVIIDLPTRSYVPVFTSRQKTEMVAAIGAKDRKQLWIFAAILVTALVVAAGCYWLGRASVSERTQAAGEVPSIAVMPFVNTDADPELEQFADGLTEEVIETLMEVEGLRVVSRTSAFQFKGKHEDLRAIAAKLNVGAVLEGTVRRSGQQLHITARLVNAAGSQYYSHVYERELKDTSALQREIAAQAAGVLQVRQRGEEVARFTRSPEASQWYLQGLYHSRRTSESELRQAIACYQRSIGYDPNYSPAHTSLSDAYISLALLNEAPADAMQRAVEAARTAVKTGETYAHAHAALGSVLALYDWNWAAAEKEFRKAVEGDPDDSDILQQYAMRYLVPQGNLDSALFELRLAQQNDPLSPQLLLNRGKVEYFKGDPGRALRDIHSALGFDPGLETGPLALAQAYVQSSFFGEASKTLENASAPTEDEARLAVLGSVYGLSRQPDRARQVLQQLLELDRHEHISGYYFAQVYLALGQTQLALDSLQKAADEHNPMIVYVRVAPQFEHLRGEPRFQSLLKQIRLNW